MPLYVALSVNSQEILDVKITRLDRTPLDKVKSDDRFKYRVAVDTEHNERGETMWQTIGEVEHRYGDGARVLACLALEAVERYEVGRRKI